MPAKARLIQVLGEALIPLLGFYLWSWNLYFIFLFFITDELVAICAMFAKSKKIVDFQNTAKSILFNNVILGLLLFLGEVSLLHFLVYNCNQNIHFEQETVNFLSYKDMGIEQGYILLPLLILVGYQRYKMEFLVPELYKKLSLGFLWKAYRQKQFFLIAFSGICIGLSVAGILNEQLYLWFFIVALGVYQFFYETSI